MDKPTIFFSHSSKDKELILPIKNKLDNITSNVMDIFMSSDGQSIPFGHNWVHKIEEGLKKAQIMFVFVTPTSINSSWIYFEAGFAYSKDIEVIPVGLGVNIGQLKPPLNLLQGFDINSFDSLNNFVSTINNKFDLSFNEDFVEKDYISVIKKLHGMPEVFNIHSIFSHANYNIKAEAYNGTNYIEHDIEKYFKQIKEYLDSENINYSINKPHFSLDEITKTILVNGIRFDIHGFKRKPDAKITDVNNHFLSINVSTLNFSESFDLLKKIFIGSNIEIDKMWLHLYFNEKFNCLKSSIEISSLLMKYKDKFSCRKDSLNLYNYKNGLSFGVIDVNYSSQKSKQHVLAISFDINEVSIGDIKDLIFELQNCNLIYSLTKS